MSAAKDAPPVDDSLLPLPAGIGRYLVETAAMLERPLLRAEEFCAFCGKRNLRIDLARLRRFERLGLFRPIFRVRAQDAGSFPIPIVPDGNWFDFHLAWDTTTGDALPPPEPDDPSLQCYYSVFQVAQLRGVLEEFTRSVELDTLLDDSPSAADLLRKRTASWLAEAQQSVLPREDRDSRFAMALLCQAISNRYYPSTQGDQRRIRMRGHGTGADRWIALDRRNWDWQSYCRTFDPRQIERRFALTPARLQHAYETLALNQSWVDPLEHWYPLVQFVALDERERLKGDALLAQTIRDGALMLRRLHHDLYGVELPPVNEVGGTVIQHMPELEVRWDPRRHLEFVANRFGVNPQPTLVLMVEGPTEARVIDRLFDEVFGFPAGRCGIEVLPLNSVDNATGGRRDFYQAIFRLMDYLLHHQTLAYLVLDNENHAEKLRAAMPTAASIHGVRKRLTRPEYLRLWDKTFEFDNFSDAELAEALTKVCRQHYVFAPEEIAACREDKHAGAKLGALYTAKTDRDIPKLELADALLDGMFSTGRRKDVVNRPIVRLLRKVATLASRNPLPVMQEMWDHNQRSRVMSTKRAPSGARPRPRKR